MGNSVPTSSAGIRGGVGAGVTVEPIAFLVSRGDEISMMNVKKGKTVEYGYGLPWSDVRKYVQEHYDDGADAVELEMISEEEFNDRLPKPF